MTKIMAEEEKGFIIKDKRFSGEKESEAKEAFSPEKAKEDEGKRQTETLPSLDFSSFLLSLSSSAMLHLGSLSNPQTGKKQKNIPLAKQTIDLIGMLKEKTKGNLTVEENRLLEEVLYNLQILYVKQVKIGS